MEIKTNGNGTGFGSIRGKLICDGLMCTNNKTEGVCFGKGDGNSDCYGNGSGFGKGSGNGWNYDVFGNKFGKGKGSGVVCGQGHGNGNGIAPNIPNISTNLQII